MKRINLLPKPKQNELIYEQIFHSVLVAVVIGICILLAGVAAQMAVWAYLDRSQVALIDDIDKLRRATDKTENAELKKQIQYVNSQMKDFEKLASQQPQWSKVLDAFASQIPEGVKISEFIANNADLEVDIAGYSPTRELVIELYNNINSDKEHFKDIDYPLENVAKPTDVQFHFTFHIQDGVLVPKIE